MHSRILSVLLVAVVSCRRAAPSSDWELVTADIDTAVTLGAWRVAHPADTLRPLLPDGVDVAGVCSAFESTTQVGSASMTRFAVFTLSPPPAGEALPADTVRLEDRACRLRGRILVETVSDSARAVATADSLGRALAATLGADQPRERFEDLNVSSWAHVHWWPLRATRVVVGAHLPRTWRDSTGAETRAPGHVFVASFAPQQPDRTTLYRLDVAGATGIDADARRVIERTTADSVLALIPLESVRDDLRIIQRRSFADTLDDRRMDTLHTHAADSILARAVIATRTSGASLAPAARAALYLGADVAIYAYAGALNSDSTGADAATRRTLSDAGVGFTLDPLGLAQAYARPLLWDAYRGDSTSYAGRVAFHTLLASGWGTEANCKNKGLAFRDVIQHGEGALRTRGDDAIVHYLLGVAYMDIVALADGALSDYVDTKSFVPEAPAARQKAIEHFRDALRSLRQPQLRRAAWTFSMRLMLNWSVPTTFICVYD